MRNGVCRVHGGLSTGPKTPEGRARVGAAQAAFWARWRKERGLPETWRYDDSRRKGGRQTAADYVAECAPRKPEEER
jgi:hypothetical protein